MWYVSAIHPRPLLVCMRGMMLIRVRRQTFRNPKADLQNILRESGQVGDANGAGATSKAAPKKKSRNVDMEKLAEALPHLQEDDLLQVVQMVHDNKSEDTYTKNDLESKFTPSSCEVMWVVWTRSRGRMSV